MNDSITNTVSFKSTLLMIDQLDQASRNYRMSRSEIIRAGITLILNKLAIRSITNNTSLDDVSAVIDKPVKQPSIKIEDTVAPVVDEDDSPIAPSLYGWN